ncbi:MAG: hypothetical protein PHZ24_10425 [Bacteroidales bacterium]|nr:hypothetical protein [Bacteroidales bacterium]
MKYLLLIIISSLFVLSSVDTVSQNYRRMRLDPNDIVLSDEKVLLFPRGFIYKTNEPDSAFYFGCFSQDCKSVIDFIENDIGKMEPCGNTVLRGYVDFCDSIKIESFQDKIKHFTSFPNKDKLSYNPNEEYILLYYFSDDMLDRGFVKNIRFFKKYSQTLSDKTLKVMVVKVE